MGSILPLTKLTAHIISLTTEPRLNIRNRKNNMTETNMWLECSRLTGLSPGSSVHCVPVSPQSRPARWAPAASSPASARPAAARPSPDEWAPGALHRPRLQRHPQPGQGTGQGWTEAMKCPWATAHDITSERDGADWWLTIQKCIS